MTVKQFTYQGRPAAAVVFGHVRTDYLVVEQRGDRAVVRESTGGETMRRLVLERPFGKWWYLTEIEPIAPSVNLLADSGWVLEGEAVRELAPGHWLFKTTKALAHPTDYTWQWGDQAPEQFVAWWIKEPDYYRFNGPPRIEPANACLLSPGEKYLLVTTGFFLTDLFYPLGEGKTPYPGGKAAWEYRETAFCAHQVREGVSDFLNRLRRREVTQLSGFWSQPVRGKWDQARNKEAFLTEMGLNRDWGAERPEIVTLEKGKAEVRVRLASAVSRP